MSKCALRILFSVLAAAAAVQTTPAQVSTPVVCSTASAPTTVRAEGSAELMGDIVLSCSGGPEALSSSINLSVYLNTQVANRILNPSTGVSDALLLIDDPAGVSAVMGTNLFQGIVTSNQLQFIGIPFVTPGTSGHRTFRITNLRGMAAGGSGSTITASIAVSAAIPIAIDTLTLTVAF